MSMLPLIGVQRPFLARFYPPSETPRAHTVISDTSAHILTLSDWTVVAQLKVDFADRVFSKFISNAYASSDDEYIFHVHDNEGNVQMFYQTPAGNANVHGATTVDDGEYHIIAVTRATNTFELFIDGSFDDGETVTIGVSSLTGDDGVGNVNPAGPASTKALRGTMAKYFVVDTAMTGAEQVALIEKGTVPGGMTVLFELLDGIDESTVVAEIGP